MAPRGGTAHVEVQRVGSRHELLDAKVLRRRTAHQLADTACDLGRDVAVLVGVRMLGISLGVFVMRGPVMWMEPRLVG